MFEFFYRSINSFVTSLCKFEESNGSDEESTTQVKASGEGYEEWNRKIEAKTQPFEDSNRLSQESNDSF